MNRQIQVFWPWRHQKYKSINSNLIPERQHFESKTKANFYLCKFGWFSQEYLRHSFACSSTHGTIYVNSSIHCFASSFYLYSPIHFLAYFFSLASSITPFSTFVRFKVFFFHQRTDSPPLTYSFPCSRADSAICHASKLIDLQYFQNQSLSATVTQLKRWEKKEFFNVFSVFLFTVLYLSSAGVYWSLG